VDSTVKAVLDGEGTASALAIGTTKVGVGTTSPSQELDVSGNVVADEYALDQTGASSSAVAIHAPTTNELAIRTNSTEAMRIDSSGNVGIETTSPSALLHVGNGNGTKSIKIKSGGGSSGDLIFESNVNEGIISYEHTTDSMRFHTNASEKMRIDSDGNVGIGTDNPTRIIDIQITDATAYEESGGGNALKVRNTSQAADTFSSLEMFAGQTSAGGANIARIFAVKESTTSTATSLAFTTRDSNEVSSEAMRIDSDGRCGIGTASPVTKLDINEVAGNLDVIQSFSKGGVGQARVGLCGATSQVLQDALANDLCIRSDGHNIKFGTASATRTDMTIDSDGKVGIGTVSPSAPLEVASTTGGVIMPRMTTTQMNAISSPTDGEMIYNTTENKFYGRANGAWTALH
jgi:hypothetical protein